MTALPGQCALAFDRLGLLAAGSVETINSTFVKSRAVVGVLIVLLILLFIVMRYL